MQGHLITTLKYGKLPQIEIAQCIRCIFSDQFKFNFVPGRLHVP